MFDVGTAIVMAEGAADVAPSGISPETWAAILGTTAVSTIVSSLIGFVGWLAKGKSQREMATLVQLEEAVQKIKPTGNGEADLIKRSQMGYVNVLMAVELSRRMVPVSSVWNYVGMAVGFIVCILYVGLMSALTDMDENSTLLACIGIVVGFILIFLATEHQRTKKKRERVDLARKMVNGQMEIDMKGNKGAYDISLNVDEMIPYPTTSMVEVFVETVKDIGKAIVISVRIIFNIVLHPIMSLERLKKKFKKSEGSGTQTERASK